MKVLIIALSGIGDALMFSPALELLKTNSDKTEIDVLVMYKGNYDIYKNNPHVTNVIHFDFLKSPAMQSLKFVFGLRKKYDASINVYPSNRKEYNIISFLIGANRRFAVNYLREGFSNLYFLNTDIIKENDDLHNVEENVKMVELILNKEFTDIPGMLFPIDNESNSYADNYLIQNSISEKDFVYGFHPGCSTLKNHINRRWAPENFIALGKKIINELNGKLLVFGGPDEKDIAEQIVTGINSENCLMVQTQNLIQTAAVMKRCNKFITNDSALMHIAAALQLNVVPLIGPTNMNYISPWKTNYKTASLNLECSPCFIYSPKPLTCKRGDVQFKCIRELTPEIVFEIVKDFK